MNKSNVSILKQNARKHVTNKRQYVHSAEKIDKGSNFIKKFSKLVTGEPLKTEKIYGELNYYKHPIPSNPIPKRRRRRATDRIDR